MDLKRQAKEEQVRRLLMKHWQNNPMDWLKDRFNEDPKYFRWSLFEGYENHVFDGSPDPLFSAWQEVVKGNWVGVEAGSGTSKTFFLSRLVLWFLDVFEDSLVVTTAPKRDQLSLHLWSEISKVFHKFKKIRNKASMLQLKLRVDGDLKPLNKGGENDEVALSNSWQVIGFVAGSKADEQSTAKAQGFHRQHMLIIVEETPGVAVPVIGAFENTCTGSHNIIIAVGNPDSEIDALHTFCSQSYVKNFRVSAYDYPNVVLNKEVFAGAVTRQSIEKRKEKYGEDSSFFKSRVRGIVPSDNENSLIKKSWIDACWEGSDTFKAVEKNGLNSIGIDVANSDKGDKACVVHGTGNKMLGVRHFQCPNAATIAHNIMLPDWKLSELGYQVYGLPKQSEYNFNQDYIGVDAVGVGVSTINTFLEPQYSLKVTSLHGGQWQEVIPLDGQKRPLYRFANLRSQMYWELREDLRVFNIVINGLDRQLYNKLRKELMVTHFAITSGAIAIESKEVIKKRLGGESPDIADSFVYWNWVRKGYRKSDDFVFMLISGGN